MLMHAQEKLMGGEQRILPGELGFWLHHQAPINRENFCIVETLGYYQKFVTGSRMRL